MASDVTLALILPLVRASLKGRANFSFENFVDGLWSELDKTGMPGIAKKNPLQGYTGYSYNFNEGNPRLREVARSLLLSLPQWIHRAAAVQLSQACPHQSLLHHATRTSWVKSVQPLPKMWMATSGSCGSSANLNNVIDQYVREGLARLSVKCSLPEQ